MDFSFLFTIFTDLWNVLEALLKGIYNEVSRVITSAWGVGVILAGILWSFFHSIAADLADALTAVTSVVFPSLSLGGTGTFSTALSIANTVLPLQEMMVFVVSYLTLCLALQLYKTVKSWLPGVAT